MIDVIEKEKEIQDIIEKRLPADGNWSNAHGRIEPAKDGGFRGFWYDQRNPTSIESIENWLPLIGAIEELLIIAGAKGCEYSFKPGERIRFIYKK